MDGQVYCGGKCVDPKTDTTFCGATGTTTSCTSAGVPCDSGEKCTNGSCAASCLAGQVYCGGKCVDPKTDTTFCGATGTTTSCTSAGVTCDSGQKCTNGSCAASCLTGQVYCGGKCVDPKTDTTFCGATGTTTSCTSNGTTCASGQKCTNGSCAASCLAGQIYCGDKCVDPNTDTTFCGATGTTTSCTNTGSSCGSGMKCINGTCTTTCGGTTVNCNGTCLDLSANHVISCDGSSLTCEEDYEDCDGKVANGCEVNITTDSNHCGGCELDNACNSQIENSNVVSCNNKICYVINCNNNYIPKDATSCVECTSSNTTNCNHFIDDINANEFSCTEGTCGLTSCKNGYSVSDKTCVCNGAKQYVSSGECKTCNDNLIANEGHTACVECTTPNDTNCKNFIVDSNANEFSCTNGTCGLTSCKNNYSVSGDSCVCDGEKQYISDGKCLTCKDNLIANDAHTACICTDNSHCSLGMKCKNNACSW